MPSPLDGGLFCGYGEVTQMLEFQEGFFEQEVRNGFYIDGTMKTLWAAEMEVLQKVAEICDRHGIVWYAAYGTLLGAIRHEGFVPWDDDMDIWVKRKDYNRLLQILPRELPQGYFVRSPQTEAGYGQFHTIVNSGDRVSIDKEWLEQYHGCPFSVGLDIFPLDYLPRDEKERTLQEQLFAVASTCAQIANTLNSEENRAEEYAETRQELKDDMMNGIRELEEGWGAKINKQLVVDEEWEKAASELFKWANYFAMMYEEEESDHLVQYMDYFLQPWKKFPKECFAEVYGATFENFILPIPCGYEQILRKIYGAYRVIRRKTGTHEYPYYARQLRTLRKKVHEAEMQAEEMGLVTSEALLSLDGDTAVPPEWSERTKIESGRKKKIVLFANDISVFAAYGPQALNKLENVLGTFEEMQDRITLWWRPGKLMAERLEKISPVLSEQYQRILSNYKEGGWGICDETDNIDRVVEWCDIYYGDMNAIIQPFQNAGKPVVLAAMGNEQE